MTRAPLGSVAPGLRWLLVLAGAALTSSPATAQERLYPWGDPVKIVRTSPEPRSLGAPVDTTITVHFDKPVRPDSFSGRGAFWAFGRWSGAGRGQLEFAEDFLSVTLVPARPFSAGESVTVVLWEDLRGVDGAPFQEGGACFQFFTGSGATILDLARKSILSTRDVPDQPTRAYGGFAGDLNEDGKLDLGIVHEVSSDLRIFLNTATGPTPYGPFEQPTTPLGLRASPSEPSDFDADGHTDVAVANTNANTVSILLGNGDGTFGPQQQIAVGVNPRGLTVMDVDGDGDTDVVVTNPLARQYSILRNDSEGVFSGPFDFDVPVDHPWALWAADMDGDYRLDLVIGAQDPQQVMVLLNRGGAVFEHVTTQACGGRVWQLVCGDLNGDGHEDVTVANGLSDNGAVLLGDGYGGLAPPVIYGSDGWCTATDLGDMDGDGDLDWNLSAFFGDFTFYTNDGDGSFTFDRKLPTFEAASCSIMYDLEGDGDLDIALVDEIADTVIVMQNRDLTLIPCAAVQSFTGSCDGVEIELRVQMNGTEQNGRIVEIDVGGIVYPQTVVGDAAVLTLPTLPGYSPTATLVRPVGCVPPIQINCP